MSEYGSFADYGNKRRKLTFKQSCKEGLAEGVILLHFIFTFAGVAIIMVLFLAGMYCYFNSSWYITFSIFGLAMATMVGWIYNWIWSMADDEKNWYNFQVRLAEWVLK